MILPSSEVCNCPCKSSQIDHKGGLLIFIGGKTDSWAATATATTTAAATTTTQLVDVQSKRYISTAICYTSNWFSPLQNPQVVTSLLPSNELLPHRLPQSFLYASWGVSFYHVPFWNQRTRNKPGSRASLAFRSSKCICPSCAPRVCSKVLQRLVICASPTNQSPTGVIAVDGSQEKAP